MAGHSKWANIRHRKAGQDARRGKVFTKLIRELTVAARTGGGSVADNPRLRAVVDKALAANMTRDTIDRAIARGAGTSEADNVEELVYESYGPGGVAILVETLTDNRNRTVSEVRHCFSRGGGNLGTSGSVSYMFTRTGILAYEAGIDIEQLLESAIAAGADDVQIQDDGSAEVLTYVEQFAHVKDSLAEEGLAASSSGLDMLAATEADLDAESAAKLLRRVEALEELDDVQNVYTNAGISPAIMEQLSS